MLFRALHISLDIHVLDRAGEGEEQQQREGFYQESLLPPFLSFFADLSPRNDQSSLGGFGNTIEG